MTAEEIKYKLGVCRKDSPGYPIVDTMRGRKICKFTPNISYMVDKRMERSSMLIIEEYTERYKHDSQFRELYHKPKKSFGNEYGYYVSGYMSHILNFMQIMGIKKICDIGCGFGVAMKTLLTEDNSIEVRGYDNEPYLVELAGEKHFQVKDALKLQKGDIEENELLYFWEPFKDKKMSAKFVDNLASVVNTGQILSMHESPAENTVTNLLHHSSFDYVCNFGKKYIFVRK
jgi:hypothetical protein